MISLIWYCGTMKSRRVIGGISWDALRSADFLNKNFTGHQKQDDAPLPWEYGGWIQNNKLWIDANDGYKRNEITDLIMRFRLKRGRDRIVAQVLGARAIPPNLLIPSNLPLSAMKREIRNKFANGHKIDKLLCQWLNIFIFRQVYDYHQGDRRHGGS